MALYEHVFLSRPDISQQAAEALAETFKGVIEANGGSVEKTEYWGLKTIAYKINKNRKAHYGLMNINAPHAAVAEMERQMRLNEDVVRFLTIRVEEHETEPSAQLGRKDRDDRRPGRDDGDRPQRPRRF
jgi:small subunit ribosomal protein S6